MKSEPVLVTRDCIATAVPAGGQVVLRKGDPVVVSQALGGSFTLMTQDGILVRLGAKDADALGRVAETVAVDKSADLSLEEQVKAELKTIYDPEIPVDIVELGLIYGTEITDAPDGDHDVKVTMTLTAPGCGIGDILRDEVQEKIAALPGVREASVEVVFDPPWEPSRMSEVAKLATGIYW